MVSDNSPKEYVGVLTPYLPFAIILLIALTITSTAIYYYYTRLHITIPTAAEKTANRSFIPLLPLAINQPPTPTPAQEPKAIWFTDYQNSTVKAINLQGQTTWEQHFDFASVPDSGQPSNVEFMTIAPNGDLMVTTANGMLVEEIDRATHQAVWHYGVLNQQYCDKCLHQPKKAYLFNTNEVLITDANNRRVIILDKNTNKIIWQYGVKAAMKDAPGYLMGNRFAVPLDDTASRILISDTLTKKIIIVDRATKNILWSWQKPDSKWLMHVFPTLSQTFIGEDHLKNDVFEVSQDGQLLWDLHTLADGTSLNYPTDVVKLPNGNLLISEAGRSRIIEVNPQTKEILWHYDHAGFATSLAVEY
jgi:outer membrane protein assembly factor BamB